MIAGSCAVINPAPTRPHAVHTIREHNSHTGVSSGSIAFPCGCTRAIENVATAVPSYVTEHDRPELIALAIPEHCGCAGGNRTRISHAGHLASSATSLTPHDRRANAQRAGSETIFW